MTERIIETNELIGEDTHRMAGQTGILDIYGDLKSPFSNDVIVLNAAHKQQIENFAALAVQNFGPDLRGVQQPEETFVQTELGVPTLIGRVDCTIDAVTGQIKPYELEDSPSGTGITDVLHAAVGEFGFADKIRDHYVKHLGSLPFVIISGARRHGTDDAITLGDENYHYEEGDRTIPDKLPDEQPVIVKAIPGHRQSISAQYRSLKGRLVCTMDSEGDKTYGERTGLFSRVRQSDELLSDETGGLISQVVKRSVGSMAMGVAIHLAIPDRQILGKKGSTTASGIRKKTAEFIQQDGFAYVQEFERPIRVDNPELRKNLIIRIFTLINPASSADSEITATAIGGAYVARPELVVHGASNSVNGAVLV